MRLRSIIFTLSIFSGFFISSCGKSDSSNNNVSKNLPVYYWGPTSCNASGTSYSLPISTQKNINTNIRSKFSIKTKMLRIANLSEAPNNYNSANLRIVGSSNFDSSHPYCLPSTNSISNTTIANFEIAGKTITSQNTVAIVIPLNNGYNDICTGTLIANNLILTAAHCFDDVYKNNSTSPGSVYFGNTLTGTSVPITCWQRNNNYISGQDSNGNITSILNDIAWIKVDPAVVSALGITTKVANIATNPSLTPYSPDSSFIAPTEKVFAGYGAQSQSDVDKGGSISLSKHCISTYAATTNYSSIANYTIPYNYLSTGDVVPNNSVSQFDQYTSVGTFENYLTVIGPIIGTNTADTNYSYPAGNGLGTCNGDSGGPVYVPSSDGTKWLLGALTQGSNSLLSPTPTYSNGSFSFSSRLADCQYGYGVYTKLSNYIDWINKSSGSNITTTN